MPRRSGPRTAGGSPDSSGLSSAAGAPTRTRCRVRCRSSSAGVSMRSPVHGRDAAERSGFPRDRSQVHRTGPIGCPGAPDTRPRPASGQRPTSFSRCFQATLEHRWRGPRRRAGSQMLRAVVLAQGQEPLSQGDRGKLAHARTSCPESWRGGPATNVADVARGQPAPPA